MKLRKLHIEDYKMFKDFDISFVDENDEALPIVVLAGVNGSGKTSLLTSILKLDFPLKTKKNKLINWLELSSDGKIHNSKNEECIIGTVYGEANLSLDEVKNLLPEYLNKIVWGEDVLASVAFERVRNDINNFFKSLNINIEFDSRDGEGNLFFRNKSGVDKFLIDELSTGEKTLMSKVLYLYLKDIKDKIILIDEPELSLHPSWQNKVLKIYENFALKNNCQIIIATHSPHIIGSAKNEYLRFLRKDDEGNIEVVDNITAYGRDIEWILEEMGVADTRLPKITKRFEEIQELINNREFDEADDELDKLEYVIGDNDKGILTLRNDLAFERMDLEEDS